MKRSKLILVLAVISILVTGFAVPGAASPSSTKAKVQLTLPSFAQMDKDTAADLKAAGTQVKGKNLVGYNAGKSYKSPTGTTVGNIDMKGHGLKGLAILVDWPVESGAVSDVPGVQYEAVPTNLFNDLLNGDTYNPFAEPMWSHLAQYGGVPAPTNLTMKNYYDEVSYGQFGMTVDVVGWLTLPHNYDYYLGQNKGHYNENGDAFIGELVKDAIMAADAAGFDFTQYAVDAKPGDFADLYGNATSFVQGGQTISKIVPNLFIVHRGTGAEYSRDPSIIWSHKWDILSASYYGQYYRTGTYPNDADLKYFTVDGVVVNTYNTVPEVGQNITGFGLTAPRQPSPPYVGVYAHEFGHVLGLPDLYDYGYDSEGVGDISLMAGGSYGRTFNNRYYSGNSPVHVDGWGKQYLGFLQFKEIYPTTTTQTVTLRPVEQYPDVYRINIPGADNREYFVMENRQQQGFDKGLVYTDLGDGTAHGLVVYQVDETVLARNFHRPNEAQNWDLNKRGLAQWRADTGEYHFGVSVIQADGRYDLEHAYYSDSSDFFPGTSNVTSLLPNPVAGQANTLSWMQWQPGRSITGITLSNIVENADGSVTVDVSITK